MNVIFAPKPHEIRAAEQQGIGRNKYLRPKLYYSEGPGDKIQEFQ